MIFGNVNNEFFDQQTAILPAPLKSALCFLKETDLAAHEPGRFEIELGGVPMVLQVLDLTTSPRQTLRPKSTAETSMSSSWPPEGLSGPDTIMTTKPAWWTRTF